uniref:USP domain-containing protein n=1 Tax=viral metagenome TaxID=1070528 RepID=A0A6C0ARE8_9ZZZZ
MKKKSRKLAGHKKRRRYNRTVKERYSDLIVPSETPLKVHKLSDRIAKKISSGSYSPTINKQLVSLKSEARREIEGCNLERASRDEEPLEIYVDSYYTGRGICIPYYMEETKDILLKNLKANKHVNPSKIITPLQVASNCWFNTLFVTFFVSDKGRKFFHFLRELMINGIQKDKKDIPSQLKNTFALLNFAIEQCLTGSELAYSLDTNVIIKSIYNHIPKSYKDNYQGIIDVDEAGNPIYYYIGIINYLNNNSLQLLFTKNANSSWREVIENTAKKMAHLPHIVVLEVMVDDAASFRKPVTFKINDAKYELDSASIIDTNGDHFCATITCEGKEMAYDGASFHRLVPLKWKNKINSDFSWQFEGEMYDGKPMNWNFTKCYQLLMYYRIE